MAGQGAVALEILEDMADMDTLVVPAASHDASQLSPGNLPRTLD